MCIKISPIDVLRVFTFLFFINGGIQVLAQSTLSSKSKKAIAYYQEADNYRVRRQYEQAIILLQNAIKKDDQFVEAYQRLADIYYVQNKLNLAEEYYQKVVNLASGRPRYADAYFFITKVQITLEKYNLAKVNIETYLTYEIKNRRRYEQVTLLNKKIAYSITNIKNRLPFNPRVLNSKVNQFAMQYFPAITVDQNTLLYTKRDGNGPFDDEDIMVSSRDETGKWKQPVSISPNINSELNEGTCTISADGRTLVFTSCQGRNGYGSCDLYISYKNGNDWSIPKNLGPKINSSAWESQASLSADGRTLYFVSNRGGGIGGRDIWVSKKQKGKWGLPKNLGHKINTKNEEVSPFIHPNGKVLYFASDGLPGFGGFDIYHSALDSAENWEIPQNIGYPINRGTDQMSLIITADGSLGLYSDSGEKNQRLSGIKQFDIPEQIKIKYKSQYVIGEVIDKITRKPLRSQIELYDLQKDELISEVNSDSISGQYLIVLTEGGKYALYVNKQRYVFQNVNFDFQKTTIKEPLTINIELTPISKGVTTVLNNIFFEHDSYDLDKESLTELSKVAGFIKDNNVKVEIGGYTDNTGTKDYNLVLSEKRAKAVYDYLILKNKVPQSALDYHGYGQDNKSEADDSQYSRRIEFKLL